MDIFKLFFNHDQRLDRLAKRNANKTPEEVEATLDDFMTPTPTFSKFYITGTRLQDEAFGLNTLQKSDAVMEAIEGVFGNHYFHTAEAAKDSLTEAIAEMAIGQAVVISTRAELNTDIASLEVDDHSNVGHLKDELREVLLAGHVVVYKEQAHQGFDLHLFSKKNIYADFFYPLQQLVDDDFRFFSINSKRMGSEKHFYFETWTLNNPPHGAEEVFPETVL